MEKTLQPKNHKVVMNLGPLLSHAPGSMERFEEQGLLLPAQDWHNEEVAFDAPLNWRLLASSTGGDDDYILEGSIAGEVIVPCRRCLEPVVQASSSDFVYMMRYQPSSASELDSLDLLEDDEGEYLTFRRPQADFTQMLLEIFIADLPLTAACEDEVACRARQESYLAHQPRYNESASPFSVLETLQESLLQESLQAESSN